MTINIQSHVHRVSARFCDDCPLCSSPSLGPTPSKLLDDLAPPRKGGNRGAHPSGEVDHVKKNKGRKPALGWGKGHTCASLSATKGVACRAAGKTKFQHRGCFPGGDTIQNYPSTPFWVDSDPCPAIASATARRQKRQEKREKTGEPARSVKTPDERCARGDQLRRKAQKIIKLLEVEQSLKAEKPLPSDFVCGSLRSKIRSMYGDGLTQVQLLSIKTSAMAESQPCPYCEGLQEDLIGKYEKARYLPRDVNLQHLESFSRAFRENVPQGWNRNKGRFPYVPNGAASLDHKKSEGGNWNTAAYSSECRVTSVFTKGKWRTVTMYSSHNVAVLTPLHNSLYSFLQRRNWLLVGNPTNERLGYLQDGCQGNSWLSFDYESATDNIKTAYVQRAVEILIERGEGLEDDEIRCLRVLGALDLGNGVTESGQPMGSPMSFPVLCLINKTVVDLALTELLLKGEISFKEWTSHRCLINGDDLLTKSTSSGSLADAIFHQGGYIGLKSNWDKTLEDPEIGEINSTVFKNCTWQKKTNVSALWMAAEVTDVLGFAQEATTSNRGFMLVVKNNVSRLARQKIKTSVRLSHGIREMLLACHKTRKALRSEPATKPPKETNLFPVVAMPDGYDLTREEEVAATLDRVREVRERGLYLHLPAERKKNAKIRKAMPVREPEGRARKGLYAILKPKKPREEQTILSIFASAWELKRKKELLAVEGDVVTSAIVSDLNRIESFIDEIRAFKERRSARPQASPESHIRGCSSLDGFVSFADG